MSTPTNESLLFGISILEERIIELRSMAYSDIKAGYMSDSEKYLDDALQLERTIIAMKAQLNKA